MSCENLSVSKGVAQAYNNVHTGHYPVNEKKHKLESSFGIDLKLSQISTLPGRHKELIEKPIYKKLKPEYFSSISEPEGFTEEKFINTFNPCIKINRNTATTAEKQVIFGKPKEKLCPKREIVPNYCFENSSYKTGVEKDVKAI